MPANSRIVTTVGRIMFSDILANGMPFYNTTLGKKGCSRVIDDTYMRLGRPATLQLLDDMKELGFKTSTVSGLSIAITDLRIPASKLELIAETQAKVDRVERNYDAGAITERERHNQLLDLWAHCREQITKSLVATLKNDRRDEIGTPLPVDGTEGQPYLNPVYLMSTSGARGNISQMQQLAGMRGLMAKPSGEIIETPIRANFREGLNVLEYFSSTHGARKGLADTALKTADSGYLTRKLYDVAQSMVATDIDCGTKMGIPKRAIYKGEEVDVPLREAIIGRTSRQTVINPMTDEVIVAENELITNDVALRIEKLGIDSVQVRSPLTCESSHGKCALCYGMDMSTGQLVEEGLAVGTIAAQSIGEPGTQLTMRTFHTGGIAARGLVETSYRAAQAGTVEIRDCNHVEVKVGDVTSIITLKRNGEIVFSYDFPEYQWVVTSKMCDCRHGRQTSSFGSLCLRQKHNVPYETSFHMISLNINML
jgi:DNA-directed RNA polymerase subunit beta'